MSVQEIIFLALSALWVGICYDQTALDVAWDLAKNWTEEFRETLRISFGERGLNGHVNETRVSELAKKLMNIAPKGLIARGRAKEVKGIENESFFPKPLRETVKFSTNSR